MRDEIDQLRTFRAGTPDPDSTAWRRAERAIAEARQRHRSDWRLAWRWPSWRLLTALSAAAVLAVAVLVSVTLSAPTASKSAATSGAGLTWSLAGYFVPKGYQLNTNGPAPGPLTCPTATTCYDQAGLVSHRVGGRGGSTFQWDRLYVSSDGARTWRAVPLPSGLAFTSLLVCQTTNTCSAGALDHGKPAFTVTRDGGRTWTTSPLPAGSGRINVLTCPATTTCRALTTTDGGFSALHLVTTNDGRQFTLTSFPAADSITDLTCPTASHCIATGLGTAYNTSFTGLVLVSNDGGVTWRPGTLPLAVRPISSLDCVDAEHCFEVDWRIHGTPGYANENGQRVLVGITGIDSEVMVSDDGGMTWTARPLPARFPSPVIDNLTCVSASTCYITGSDSVAQRFDNGNAISGGSDFAAVTQDAGLTWQAMGLAEPPASQLQPGEPPDVFMSVSSLDCPQVNICIALADNVAGNKYAAIYTTAP
jgi:photosystem II stability/assembly factor-like uncharacterized protein